MSIDRILNVPYYTQPTNNTCQSTCLKMFAKYLEQQGRISTPAGAKTIQDIWNEINTGNERPLKVRNSYANMKWWLEKYFLPTKFQVKQTRNVDEAISNVVKFINFRYPIMVSTNHDRTAGHIILVIGYEGYTYQQCNPNIKFVCHDPYGKFDPQLNSNQYGSRRYDTGMCLAVGGEVGPGKAVKYDYEGIKRIRQDKHSAGTYFLISAKI